MPNIRAFEHVIELHSPAGQHRAKLTLYREYEDPIGVAKQAQEMMNRTGNGQWVVMSAALHGPVQLTVRHQSDLVFWQG